MPDELSPAAGAVFVHSPELERYSYPENCPFSAKRAGLTRQKIASMGLLGGDDAREAPPQMASRSELETYHSPRYLDAILKAQAGELDADAFLMGLGTPDCPLFPGMYEYAAWACGATLTGARLIADRKAWVVFNPSGGYHHAFRAKASGFCYVNDIVIAALELLRRGLRIAVFDVDVHHCDAVQDAFYRRGDVLVVSMHESGRTLFPGTGFEQEAGEAEGRGCTVNIPLPVGAYDAAYFFAYKEAVAPVLRAYSPDVIILELGMDALAGDPLAHLNLTNNVFVDIIEDILSMQKPVLATGGGGYNVENTVRGWALCWSVLCGRYSHDISAGMGGVMLENTDWAGGLRDRTLISDAGRRENVDREIRAVVKRVRELVFPLHGLSP